MGKRRCPNCGKRVADEEPCCPRCGYAIPFVIADLEEDGGPSFDADCEPSFDSLDEEIDDPELLDLATENVRGLPLRVIPMDAHAPEADEPARVGWECHACGRQAQQGWRECPWCGNPLPAQVWKREGQDWGD